MTISFQTNAARTNILLRIFLRRWGFLCLFAVVAAVGSMQAQQQGAPKPDPPATAVPAQAQPTQAPAVAPAPATPAQAAPAGTKPDKNAKPPSSGDRRRAAKLYLAAGKLFEQQKYPQAIKLYEAAAQLDPTNPDYALAAGVARSHQVTALIQAAAKDRTKGDSAAARAALAQALELDRTNPQIAQHLDELGADATADRTPPLYAEGPELLGPQEELVPTTALKSFHLHVAEHQMIEQVFKAYGIQPTIDNSVHSMLARLDVDDVNFADAMRILSLLTQTFYVPLDAHRAVVALDTTENRKKFEHEEVETLYLSGLNAAEMTEVSNLTRNIFDSRQAVPSPAAGTMTLRGTPQTLNAINGTLRSLLEGHNQVLLDVRLIQLAHTNERNSGVTPPATISAFNIGSEEAQIINQNQALVQQIVSSGLAPAGDLGAILLILLASGQVSNSLFSNGFALFGGGITLSGVSFDPISAKMTLNSTDSRELDDVQLRLGDGEDGTIKLGERYPIETASYSSLASGSSIAGLTGAGNSSQLNGLLSSLSSAATATIPQFQYEDIGLTLKATPKVMRGGLVALTVDLKINSLAGAAINSVPVLNNRAFSGVVTLKDNEGIVVVSEIDKQESRAISGTPGISEIPGMNDLTDKDVSTNYASLLIVITPHVVRGTQAAGHSPMFRIEKGTAR
jgi:type II secretory pathway component GspD/PulD (secretin)